MKTPPTEEALFQAAIALPPGDRTAFLDRECDGNPGLRARLDALLAAHEQPDTLLSPPGAASLLTRPTIRLDLPDPPTDDTVGMSVGRYKLLERLGEGGCGVVYVAEQTEPVRRRVALKVIKLGMDTKAVVARFEAERQALAMMDHPNIAKVLDAGTTDSGRPYFVMELVRGIRITEYCDQAQLPTRERLDLFIKVCQAIQHAHQKGIIHRDIKPSNILVTLHDGVPVPKVIDFGIAKATEGRLTDATVYTQLHQFIGTPAYMSPEQAEMSGLDIDTRSDIYSLGVLLYEMLVGRTPFDAKELMASGLDAMRRTIREQEPVRPSTRLAMLHGEELTTAARRRSAEPPRLIHLLQGDLDWIVMRCLEKDRSRRYDTANGLAADLKRHLGNEPVVARPPNAAYRFQKAWRRNRLVFAAGTVVAVALVVGIGVSTWQAHRALEAEAKARLAEQQERQQADEARSARDRATQAESEALASLRDARQSAYVSELNVAFSALADNNLGRVRDLLDLQRPKEGSDDLRGFEWRYLWQLSRGHESGTFHDRVAVAADFSPDGRFFAYGDRGLIVRDSATLKTVVTLPVPVSTLSFAPRSRWLVTAHEQTPPAPVVAPGHGGVTIWDTENWQAVRKIPDAMYPALFSPDERWLVTGVAGGFRVWDSRTWQLVGDCPGAPIQRWNARHAIAFSPDSQFLVTIAEDHYPVGDHFRVWHLPSLEEREALRITDGETSSLAFTPDGKEVVTGLFDGRVVVWDFASRRPILIKREHTAWIPAVMMAEDGKTFVTASADRTIVVWDRGTCEPRTRFRGHTGELWHATLSPDGRTVISGSNDGTTKVWKTDPHSESTVLEGPNLVAGFTDGGRRMVGVLTNAFRVLELASGVCGEIPLPAISAPVLTGNWGRPYAVKPNELIGVRGREDGTVEAWDLLSGARPAQWIAHDQRVGTLAFCPQGRLLATGSTTGEVKVWEYATRREVARFGPIGGQALCVAFSTDGKTLAASGASSEVWVWGLETRRRIHLYGNDPPVFSIAFSPDGGLLAVTTMAANEVRLWELPSGRLAGQLRGHVAGVCSVAFSPDGKTLATGGTDRRVVLWNVAVRQEMATVRTGNLIPMVEFSPDGRILTVGDLANGGRRIQLLRAPDFAEIEVTEARERDRHYD